MTAPSSGAVEGCVGLTADRAARPGSRGRRLVLLPRRSRTDAAWSPPAPIVPDIAPIGASIVTTTADHDQIRFLPTLDSAPVFGKDDALTCVSRHATRRRRPARRRSVFRTADVRTVPWTRQGDKVTRSSHGAQFNPSADCIRNCVRPVPSRMQSIKTDGASCNAPGFRPEHHASASPLATIYGGSIEAPIDAGMRFGLFEHRRRPNWTIGPPTFETDAGPAVPVTPAVSSTGTEHPQSWSHPRRRRSQRREGDRCLGEVDLRPSLESRVGAEQQPGPAVGSRGDRFRRRSALEALALPLAQTARSFGKLAVLREDNSMSAATGLTADVDVHPQVGGVADRARFDRGRAGLYSRHSRPARRLRRSTRPACRWRSPNRW